MKKLFWLFFLFTGFQFYAQPNDTSIEELKKKTLNYLSKNEDSLALIYSNQLYTDAVLLENELAKHEAYYLIGRSYISSSLNKALENYEKATPFLVENKHPYLSDLHFAKATIYITHSEFPKAIEAAMQSLAFNKENKFESNVQRDMSYIGFIHDRMYEYRVSIDWNKKALVIAEKLNDSLGMARCFGRIGIAYDELAELDGFNKILFDSALYFNKKAAELSELAGNLGFARTTYSNIGNSFSKLKMYDQAEEYTLKSLAVPGFEANKGVTLVNLGKIYLETGRYEAAKKILDSAMANTIKHGTRKYQFEAYYRFHELAVKQGDYKKALKNYISYKSIEDSLLNETKNKQIIETREQFQTAEKEKEILTQRAEIAEQELTIKTKNLFAVGLGFSAIILGLTSYFMFKKKERLANELDLKDALSKARTQNRLQEQRLRISRDLHDNIGSQLTYIISSIDNLKFLSKRKDDELSSKLTQINDFASGTISQLRDTIWAMNKNEIPIDDFQGRVLTLIEKVKSASNGIEINFMNTINSTFKFDSAVGINTFRVIQESLHNAIKHARPKKIDIEMSESSKSISVKITDDGIGFDIEKVELGNGLENMQHRVEEVNGIITIESKKDQGASIKLTLMKNTQ